MIGRKQHNMVMHAVFRLPPCHVCLKRLCVLFAMYCDVVWFVVLVSLLCVVMVCVVFKCGCVV